MSHLPEDGDLLSKHAAEFILMDNLLFYCVRMLVSTDCYCHNALDVYFFFYHGSTVPIGPGPPHYRGFKITLRHTAMGRTPLYE